MHRDFADWYRAVSLEPKAEELQKRWQAVEAFVKDSKATDLAELSRLFYGLAPRDAKFEEEFRCPFKEADETFAMKGNTPELRVLAGVALVRHFKHEGEWAAAAALALASAACQGLRIPPVAGILELALNDLSRQSAALRRRAAKPLPELDLAEELQAIKTAAQNSQVPNLADPLNKVLQKLVNAVGQLNAWAERIREGDQLRQEESDVFWWLAGEHSRDLGKPLGDLKSPSACLIAPKELSEIVRVLPGPYAAEAFLDNALRKAHPALKSEVTIAEALNSSPEEWRKELFSADGLEAVLDLCPVHLAAQKYVESAGKKGWQTAFQTTAGFKGTEKLKPLALAVQVYQERLFARALRELEETDNA